MDVRDIAHALALTCRFTGHVRTFYSVAEHSCRVHDAVIAKWPYEQNAFEALFHDAAEAYLVDIAKPIKDLVGIGPRSFVEHEHHLLMVIAAALGKPWHNHPGTKHFDIVLLVTEARDLLGPPPELWSSTLEYDPLVETIEPWPWEKAEAEFLKRWEALC